MWENEAEKYIMKNTRNNNLKGEDLLRREMAMLAEIVVNEYFEQKIKERRHIL
jgi:hypothetical protein